MPAGRPSPSQRASLRGRLLIATPALVEANFRRTIVLVLEHAEEGALGVVLNRPSSARMADNLPQWVPKTAEPPVIFVGGPVARDEVICLAEVAGLPEG